jgi:hypothetical protein
VFLSLFGPCIELSAFFSCVKFRMQLTGAHSMLQILRVGPNAENIRKSWHNIQHNVSCV